MGAIPTKRSVARQKCRSPHARCLADAAEANFREGWELDYAEIQVPDKTAILGRGSFGVVYRGVFHGSEVAVKLIRYAENKQEAVETFAQEVAIMTKLHHPNICMILGVAVSQEKRRMLVVTELLSVGSLCVCTFLASFASPHLRARAHTCTHTHILY